MSRGYKPQKSSADRSNLFAMGQRDPVLRKYLGPTLLAKLGGRKPARPANNFEAAKAWYLKQAQKGK